MSKTYKCSHFYSCYITVQCLQLKTQNLKLSSDMSSQKIMTISVINSSILSFIVVFSYQPHNSGRRWIPMKLRNGSRPNWTTATSLMVVKPFVAPVTAISFKILRDLSAFLYMHRKSTLRKWQQLISNFEHIDRIVDIFLNIVSENIPCVTSEPPA